MHRAADVREVPVARRAAVGRCAQAGTAAATTETDLYQAQLDLFLDLIFMK